MFYHLTPSMLMLSVFRQIQKNKWFVFQKLSKKNSPNLALPSSASTKEGKVYSVYISQLCQASVADSLEIWGRLTLLASSEYGQILSETHSVTDKDARRFQCDLWSKEEPETKH